MASDVYYVVFYWKKFQHFHDIHSVIHLIILLVVVNSVNDTEKCKDESSYP